MFINFHKLASQGFEARGDMENGIEIRPMNPRPIEAVALLRDEAGLSDMQVEEIILTVHEFQVWNAITHK